MPAAITGALLTRVPAAFHGGINDVLLTGLVLAVADWCRRRSRGTSQASHALLLDLEGHGREEVFADVDLSRTVGWFTSLFPVRLDAGALDLDEALAGGPALGRALKLVKEQLRALPDHGLGYGLLRYLNRETASQLDGFALPQIGFNYLGRFGGAAPAGAADWGGAPEAVTLGSGGDPAMPLAHVLEVNALTLDGAAGAELSASWSWAPALLSDEEVRDLAQRWFQALEALVHHVAQPEAGGRTPSDLPLLALSQAEIERLEQRYPRIEDIVPLSPLQEGLLFHALYDAQAPDVYTVQLVLSLQGPLDAAALQAAVQALIDRHASLRAGFQHESLSRPVQIIVPHLAAPCHRIDLSLLDAAEREQRLAGILAQDRAERFDLASPPLHPLHADPAFGRRASAGADQPSHPDGRLVDAGAGAGAAHALCAARGMPPPCRGRRPTATTWRGSPGRTAPPRPRPGKTPWRGWRRARMSARLIANECRSRPSRSRCR